MDDQLTFGQWLKQQRRERGLTQEALAGLAAVSAVYLRKIEAGERQPARQVVERLLEALRIPLAAREAILRDTLIARPRPTPSSRSTLPSPPTPLIGREAELIGSNDHFLSELEELCAMARAGSLVLDEVVTAEVPLDAAAINGVLDALEAGKAPARTVVVMP